MNSTNYINDTHELTSYTGTPELRREPEYPKTSVWEDWRIGLLLRRPRIWWDARKVRSLPVVNLDDESPNCPSCGNDHHYKTKFNARRYCVRPYVP